MDEIIEHPGLVQAIREGRAHITVNASGCDGCSHGGGCAMNKLVRSGREAHMELPAPPGLQVGDQVLLRLPESRIAQGAALGYVLPTLLVLAGAGLGNIHGDLAAMLGAGVGFVLALGFTRLLVPRIPGLLPLPEIVVTHPAPDPRY
jgi:sigma-E factor negative regulatory protein RseC